MPESSSALRLLLIGPNGQIGYELNRALKPLGQVITAGRSGADIDIELASLDSLKEKLRGIKAGVIVNAAAYTAVDQAESERDVAFAINADAPGVLAQCARQNDALLVHFSTDYVFDGRKESAYVEDDTPNPTSVYGASKLAGEQAIRASGANHLILRTSWVYGLRGKNFLLTMLKLMAERDGLRVVNDQFGVPNWSRTLAAAATQVIRSMLEAPEKIEQQSGTYHLSATGETTWHGFAEAILESVRDERGIRAKAVTPITTAEFPTPARRPPRSTLKGEKVARDFGVRLPDWRECLRGCLRARAQPDRQGD